MTSSHASRTTRYRRQAWSARDTLLVAFSAVPLVAVVASHCSIHKCWCFYPYPRVILPPFDVRLGLCLALLGAPVLMRPSAERGAVSVEV